MVFKTVTGINGRAQVMNPTTNGLWVRRQNIEIPPRKLRIFPRIRPIG